MLSGVYACHLGDLVAIDRNARGFDPNTTLQGQRKVTMLEKT